MHQRPAYRFGGNNADRRAFDRRAFSTASRAKRRKTPPSAE